jgi:hypothetical protein
MDNRAPMITTIHGDQCPDRRTCPGIHVADVDPGGAYVVGARVTNEQILDAFAGLIGPNEVLTRVPIELIPEANSG